MKRNTARNSVAKILQSVKNLPFKTMLISAAVGAMIFANCKSRQNGPAQTSGMSILADHLTLAQRAMAQERFDDYEYACMERDSSGNIALVRGYGFISGYSTLKAVITHPDFKKFLPGSILINNQSDNLTTMIEVCGLVKSRS